MFQLMEQYILSEYAREEIDPTTWLSVIDFTERIAMDHVSDYARDRFYDTFDWENLLTDAYQRRKEKEQQNSDDQQMGGRKVKGRTPPRQQ